ncbi:hypothetical protein [Cohaesibacter celericrescens]|uniref:hypothetical protein n=1 Tax=Cohaesibacter celericrescens TaxID=2067669 RepID=UPI0011AF64E0|nr:hypothetical protein [Cohaesibacter celericrescens]
MLRAQEHLQKNAQRAVTQMKTQLDQLRQKEKTLLLLMSEGDPMLVNSLMHSHTKQIKRVSQDRKKIDAALQEMKEQTRKHGVSMEIVKRLISVQEEAQAKMQEKKDQLELIDQSVQKNQSF